MSNNTSDFQNDSVLENFSDVLEELSEVELDRLLNNEIVKDIPVISTAVNICKAVNGIRERAYLKRLQQFINAMNQGIATSDKVEYYKERLTNKKQRNKELEYILLLIDRYLHIDKTIFLAKLYLAYLDETIKWDEFVTLSEILDMLMPKDYNVLKSDYTYRINRDNNTDNILRLAGLGLIIRDPHASFKIDYEITRQMNLVSRGYASNIDKDKIQNTYLRTELGAKLVDIIESR